MKARFIRACWSSGPGGADLGIALTKGNSDTTSVALGAALLRETVRDKMTVYAAAIYNREKTAGISRTVANTARKERQLSLLIFVP